MSINLLYIISYITKLINRQKFENTLFKGNWDHLILLDACRYDLFNKIFPYIFEKRTKDNSIKMIEFTKHISSCSCTAEWVHKVLMSDNFIKIARETIFINANPIIDLELGKKINKIFFKYVPVHRYAWNDKYGTVLPSDVFYYTLKYFINHPNKRFYIHFLQPHFPYIGSSISSKRLAKLTNKHIRNFVSTAKNNSDVVKRQSFILNLRSFFANNFIFTGPIELWLYAELNKRDIVLAYFENLLIVLQWVKKLTSILPGRIIITADHGESFGEYIHKLIPIRVYGHPCKLNISQLNNVPFLIIENKRKSCESIKLAIREIIKMKKIKYVLR